MFDCPNATIYYQTTDLTTVGEDPITGEPIFTETTTEDFIRVSIEKDTVEPTIGVQPGKDSTEHFHSGRLISPEVLPSWYKQGCTYRIEWDDGKVAEWYAYPTVRSRFGLQSVFGERIEGVLRN